jgi:putative transcriptional regulator
MLPSGVPQQVVGYSMPHGFKRLALALVLMILPVTLVNAALPTPNEAPDRTFLVGQLLIASPAMGDPRFEHAVVLMVRHNEDGAFGIVINRPIGTRSFAALLPSPGDNDDTAETVPIYRGGPVQPELGFVIHSAEYHRAETLDIDGRLAMTASFDVLRDIASKHGPNKSLVAFGYAGWGPGQLEGELAHGAWFTAPADPALVFDDDRDQVWEHAMQRRTQDL